MRAHTRLNLSAHHFSRCRHFANTSDLLLSKIFGSAFIMHSFSWRQSPHRLPPEEYTGARFKIKQDMLWSTLLLFRFQMNLESSVSFGYFCRLRLLMVVISFLRRICSHSYVFFGFTVGCCHFIFVLCIWIGNCCWGGGQSSLFLQLQFCRGRGGVWRVPIRLRKDITTIRNLFTSKSTRKKRYFLRPSGTLKKEALTTTYPGRF